MISKIKGVIQPYAWGGLTFLAQTLGVENTEQQPMAEYWLGAHPKAPSTLNDGQSLAELIEENPIGLLGPHQAKAFENKLPFLLKILDVKNTLSIQVHPTKAEAVTGFEKENQAGVALTAFNRNFKDDNHKPEIMVALSDFWLLHGFKETKDIINTFTLYKSLSIFLADLEEKGLTAFYKDFMSAPVDQIEKQMEALIDEISSTSPSKESPDYWALKYYQEEGLYDRGILSIYMMNLVFIKKGDGIFQAAGIPHAYLEGQNIELMANSDNVLRGGLTPKHVDIEELIKHTSFEPVDPKVMQADQLAKLNSEKAFTAPIPDFLLTQIELSAGEVYEQKGDNEFEILLSVDPRKVILNDGESETEIAMGEACMISYHTAYSLRATKGCTIYKATLPKE